MSNKLTKQDFVKRAIAKHGNKYDYSLVNYQKNSVKVKYFVQSMVFLNKPQPTTWQEKVVENVELSRMQKDEQ